MTVRLNEEALRKAVMKADRLFLDSLPSDDRMSHIFSGRFERGMKKLIRRSERSTPAVKTHVWRKRWVAVLAAVIMTVSAAMSVSAVRQSVFRFASQIYEKYSRIFFSQTVSAPQSETGFTECRPSWLPAGFQLVQTENNGLLRLEYENGADMISYSQQNAGDVTMNINTEGVVLEDVKVGGLSAKYYSNQGMQNLIWHDDRYVYTVSSTLDRNTVFEIAESVTGK